MEMESLSSVPPCRVEFSSALRLSLLRRAIKVHDVVDVFDLLSILDILRHFNKLYLTDKLIWPS